MGGNETGNLLFFAIALPKQLEHEAGNAPRTFPNRIPESGYHFIICLRREPGFGPWIRALELSCRRVQNFNVRWLGKEPVQWVDQLAGPSAGARRRVEIPIVAGTGRDFALRCKRSRLGGEHGYL